VQDTSFLLKTSTFALMHNILLKKICLGKLNFIPKMTLSSELRYLINAAYISNKNYYINLAANIFLPQL